MTIEGAASEATAGLRAGRQALAVRDWAAARGSFEAVVARSGEPEALEGLSVAQWCLGDAGATLASLERAYRVYQDRSDRRSAARVATELAVQYETCRGEPAVANGWVQRAHRLLEGLEPGPEHALLVVWEAHLALLYWRDTAKARQLVREGLGLSRALRLADIEMLALGLEGVLLVHDGRIAEGMSRLDEVTAAAVSGEVKDLAAAGNACCYMLTACEQVGDYDRLGQWFERVRVFVDDWRYRPALTFCRNHMIALLLWRGTWQAAETEIEAMRRESAELAPGFVAEATLRLAELRRRQGRHDEAERLYAEVENRQQASLGRAALALDRGDAGSAADLADRFLRRLPAEERLERAPGLELLARASLALGRTDAAEGALAQLRELARAADTEAMHACVRALEGARAAQQGDHETARRQLEDAIDLYLRSGSGYETSRARLDLARTLMRLGRRGPAAAEASAALEMAERIGARLECERARALLAGLSPEPASAVPPPPQSLPGLSGRESEVLGLVAQGLSNIEIAERLFLSEHTVKRHVANILTKLDLPSRAAAAAAYAARRGA
jgi:ATP/maltotriose-dependent transcriptional regulator MalT